MTNPLSDETERQTAELADAIQRTINEHGEVLRAAGRIPLMNSLAGALVYVEAGMLAAIEPRARKALRKSMQRLLTTQIAETRPTGFAQTIDLGAPRQ